VTEDLEDEFDPFTITFGGQESPPELAAMRRALSRGDWKTGAALIREMGRAIPDGVALRYDQEHLRSADELSQGELIKRGRRRIATSTFVKQRARGAVETKPQELTGAHYDGREPWEVRDRYPGAIAIAAAARIVGINANTIITWIRQGYVPTPPRTSGDSGQYLITPDILAVLKRVKPHWGNGRWKVDPKSEWAERQSGYACPHCGGSILIDVTVAAPYRASTAPDPEPEVPSDPSAAEAGDEV
jgi:hypothetical protein